MAAQALLEADSDDDSVRTKVIGNTPEEETNNAEFVGIVLTVSSRSSFSCFIRNDKEDK